MRRGGGRVLGSWPGCAVALWPDWLAMEPQWNLTPISFDLSSDSAHAALKNLTI